MTALACAEVSQEPSEPQNLLVITLDTLRADHLGLYGYERPTSPHLDRFAARATVFEDVTCSMPTTLPSHLTIFTGLPPLRHGVRRNGMMPRDDLASIFPALRDSGRRTAAIVSAGVLEQRFLEPLDFDDFYYDQEDPGRHFVDADVVNQRALAWLQEHGERPFALWVHYFDTHEPYSPPPEFAARFKGDYDGPLSDTLSIPWLVSLNDPEAREQLSERDLQHVINLYDAEIAYLDAALGHLFDWLEKQPWLEETLVLIVGDHGQAHGEDQFFGHGEKLLEPVIQTPFLMRLPGQEQAFRVPAAIETLDIAPTLNELFGLDLIDLPGRSLVAALQGGSVEPARLRWVERRVYPDAPERRGLVVHAGQRKWTWYRDESGESFHLGRRDGSGGLDGQNFHDPASKDAQLFLELLESQSEAPPSASPMSKETEEMLRSLGYL